MCWPCLTSRLRLNDNEKEFSNHLLYCLKQVFITLACQNIYDKGWVGSWFLVVFHILCDSFLGTYFKSVSDTFKTLQTFSSSEFSSHASFCQVVKVLQAHCHWMTERDSFQILLRSKVLFCFRMWFNSVHNKGWQIINRNYTLKRTTLCPQGTLAKRFKEYALYELLSKELFHCF